MAIHAFTRTALISSLGGGAWENDGVSIVTETVKYLVSKFEVFSQLELYKRHFS